MISCLRGSEIVITFLTAVWRRDGCRCFLYRGRRQHGRLCKDNPANSLGVQYKNVTPIENCIASPSVSPKWLQGLDWSRCVCSCSHNLWEGGNIFLDLDNTCAALPENTWNELVLFLYDDLNTFLPLVLICCRFHTTLSSSLTCHGSFFVCEVVFA